MRVELALPLENKDESHATRHLHKGYHARCKSLPAATEIRQQINKRCKEQRTVNSSVKLFESAISKKNNNCGGGIGRRGEMFGKPSS